MQKALLDDAKDEEGRDRFTREIKRLEASIATVTEQASMMQVHVDRCRKETEKVGSSSIDIEIMQNEIKTLSAVLSQIGTEREKLKVEARATPRVTLLQRAEVPETTD